MIPALPSLPKEFTDTVLLIGGHHPEANEKGEYLIAHPICSTVHAFWKDRYFVWEETGDFFLPSGRLVKWSKKLSNTSIYWRCRRMKGSRRIFNLITDTHRKELK